MPTTCDADAFYLGSVGPLTRVYVGSSLVWPCWDCTTPDPEYTLEEYADALFYLPKVCPPLTPSALYKVSDAVSDLVLTQGDGYNGVYATDLNFETWGFNPPITENVGEIIVEAEFTSIANIVGSATSSVSFYIDFSDEITLADEGLLLIIEDLSVEIVASVFFGTTIKASVPNPTLLNPLNLLEITATTDLLVDTETKVTIEYYLTEISKKLTIYYGQSVVGEIEEVV